jgi:hypothetical protein
MGERNGRERASCYLSRCVESGWGVTTALREPDLFSQDWRKWSEREHATLALYGDRQGRIPDEAAVQLGRDFMVIRPACAILHTQGLLRETGVRRKARRRSAAELVITEKGLAVLGELGRGSSESAA